MFKLCITGDLGFEFWKDIPGYEGYYKILLNKYASLTEASIATNTAKGNIYACCVNKRKTANGFIWKYA